MFFSHNVRMSKPSPTRNFAKKSLKLPRTSPKQGTPQNTRLTHKNSEFLSQPCEFPQISGETLDNKPKTTENPENCSLTEEKKNRKHLIFIESSKFPQCCSWAVSWEHRRHRTGMFGRFGGIFGVFHCFFKFSGCSLRICGVTCQIRTKLR